MEPTTKMKRLLERMTKIEWMERGKLCRMTGRPHYNHQTWRNGRNEVHYVPASEAAAIQKAIEGYQLFIRLAEQYVDEVIRLTRREQEKKKRTGVTLSRNSRLKQN
jgi:hypothetical protein